jgi:hypothetical protein
MANAPSGYTIEPEPENNILTMRVQHVVLDTPEALDAVLPAILAGFQAMDWQPCFVLIDISGLIISPRIRTYMQAQGRHTEALIRALAVFSPQPDPVTELLLRAGSGYSNIPYVFAPDEATARAEFARLQAAE